jgi:hypothetical protein
VIITEGAVVLTRARKKKRPRTDKILREPRALTASNRRIIGHMNPTKPARIVWLVLAGLLVAAWALIIWVAMQVTQTALETLAYIVDLAQYTP